MQIFESTKSFPKAEQYALTDQIRRSSRAVCALIAEGYGKRKYPAHFAMKLTNAIGETYETIVWVEYSKDCCYIDPLTGKRWIEEYNEVG